MSSGQDAGGLSELFTEFVQQVTKKADNPLGVMQEVRRWTDDQPFLSNHLCRLILVHPDPLPNGQEEVIVQQIVQESIITDWENNTASAHFQEVIQTILDDEQRDAILNVYLQILQRAQVSVNSSQEQEKLIQSGLVKRENSKLKVGNAIYASIFNSEWVKQQLPDIAQPISTTSPAIEDNQTTSFTKLLSGIALVAVVVAAVAHPFFKSDDPPPTSEPTPSPLINTKDLYNEGIRQGGSGNWLPMLRNFCDISENSTHFKQAKGKLEQLSKSQFKDNVQSALDTFLLAENDSCPVAEDIFEFPSN